MKTFESFFLLIQLLVPGALCVGDTLPPDAHHLDHPKENPYARMVAAFRNARCAEVKTAPLKLVGDTLIVDAFRPYYSPEFQYPYNLLYSAEGTQASPAKAANHLVMQDRGFTDAQELRIPISKPGHYYLLINDVNRSMLAVVVGGTGARGRAPRQPQPAAPASFVAGELRIGCVVYE